jgi:hypothetical protein
MAARRRFLYTLFSSTFSLPISHREMQNIRKKKEPPTLLYSRQGTCKSSCAVCGELAMGRPTGTTRVLPKWLESHCSSSAVGLPRVADCLDSRSARRRCCRHRRSSRTTSAAAASEAPAGVRLRVAAALASPSDCSRRRHNRD